MGGKCFLDTNIFTNSFDQANPDKAAIAKKLVQDRLPKQQRLDQLSRVAAANEARCELLYSEDLRDGARFERIVVKIRSGENGVRC